MQGTSQQHCVAGNALMMTLADEADRIALSLSTEAGHAAVLAHGVLLQLFLQLLSCRR